MFSQACVIHSGPLGGVSQYAHGQKAVYPSMHVVPLSTHKPTQTPPPPPLHGTRDGHRSG